MQAPEIGMSKTTNDEESGVRVFHPVYERSPEAWFPGDEGTSLLVAVLHVWADIERLIRLRTRVQDRYDCKLLLQ